MSVNAVLPMFLMIAAGYLARRAGVLRREDVFVVNKIAFNVFLPCLLFYNVYSSELSTAVRPRLMLYAVVGVLLVFACALVYVLCTEKVPARRGVMIQGLFRSNYVIMGLPIATALLGESELGTVSILIAVVVPVFNVLAVVVLEVFRGGRPKASAVLLQILKNPLIISSALGILVLLAGITLPKLLVSSLRSMGAVATPLQLFLLGAFFQFDGLRRYRRELTAVVLGKLVVAPAVFLSLAAALGFRGVEFVSLLGVFASPTAVNSFTMTQQMGGDEELAGDIVILTSALSALTFFGWIFLFKSLGVF